MNKLVLFSIAAMCTVSLLAQSNLSTKEPANDLYGIHNGHEYVDLGLRRNGKKILFATMNVGAESETDDGDHFAWGDIIGTTVTSWSFDWDHYLYANGAYNKLTKYCDYSPYWDVEGKDSDNKVALDSEDDVASVFWGGAWRMPDKEELEYLISSSVTHTWTNDYNGTGVAGLVVTSSGASLFLPAAGYCDSCDWYDAGNNGRYWSRSLDTGVPFFALALYFEAGRGSRGMDYGSRFFGISVRPVLVLPE